MKGSLGGLKWWKREASRLDRVAKGNVLPGGRQALPEARGPEARLREIGGIKCRPGRPGVLALYRGVSGMELHRLAIAVGTEQSRAHIRWMIRRDMSEVQRIETACFEHPWTDEDFLRCLKQRNCIGMVAEIGDSIGGFMIYELHKNRLHILDFAVQPAFQRQGIGQQMVSKLLGKLSSHRRTKITLEIRESNLAAQLFFRKQGFRATRVLHAYFEDNGEDAYFLQYLLETNEGDGRLAA